MQSKTRFTGRKLEMCRMRLRPSARASSDGRYSSQFTKLWITRIGFWMPNTSTVRRRIYSLMVVMPSERSIENLVIGK